MPDTTATIFISYSHKDRPYLDELLEAVAPALRNSIAPPSPGPA